MLPVPRGQAGGPYTGRPMPASEQVKHFSMGPQPHGLAADLQARHGEQVHGGAPTNPSSDHGRPTAPPAGTRSATLHWWQMIVAGTEANMAPNRWWATFQSRPPCPAQHGPHQRCGPQLSLFLAPGIMTDPQIKRVSAAERCVCWLMGESSCASCRPEMGERGWAWGQTRDGQSSSPQHLTPQK